MTRVGATAAVADVVAGCGRSARGQTVSDLPFGFSLMRQTLQTHETMRVLYHFVLLRFESDFLIFSQIVVLLLICPFFVLLYALMASV